ncbi:MAG: OmpA family protein [Deltaproteobacteria bacterium]|nr:MAG: OmpA family protein [Deltaproteobacteria bacterium]
MRFALLSLSLLISGSAAAQSFDAHGFAMASDDGDLADLLTTWRPERQALGAFGFSGLFEYAKAPFVQYRSVNGGDPMREPLLDNAFALNLGFHAGLHERVGVALTGPIYFTSSGLDGAQGPSAGDFRLSVPVGLVLAGDDEGGFGLSAVPFANLPIGAQERYQGDGGFGGGALLAAGWRGGPLDVSYNLGIETGPSPDLYNLQASTQLLTGLGGSFAVSETLAVRAEASFRPGLGKNEVAGAGSPGELLVSARGVPSGPGGLSWTAGGSLGVTPGASAASFRLFAGVGYAIGKERDLDGDGFADHEDACPEEAETRNDYKDDDGCPDMLANVRVKVTHPEGGPMAGVPVRLGEEIVGRTDANGELVLEGRMPGEAVEFGLEPSKKTGVAGYVDTAMTLVEGDNELSFDLVWLPGAVRVITRSNEGNIVDATVSFLGPEHLEPEPLGEDGEEIFVLSPGDWTLLISAESFGTERKALTIEANQLSLVVVEVVLSPAVVQMTTEEVVILEQVQFDVDEATIKPESERLLTEVANNLLVNPEITRVEVQGHTDSQGKNSYNLDLSQRRVDAVLEFLKAAGVPDARIVSVGYGESCPLADNRTQEGRALNRRVQFIILEPAPEGGVPCHDGNPARRAESVTIERTIEVEQ